MYETFENIKNNYEALLSASSLLIIPTLNFEVNILSNSLSIEYTRHFVSVHSNHKRITTSTACAR